VANKAIEEGASARTARENLRRIRTEKDVTWTALSKMLADVGRKIPAISLRRIEDGDRRMDVDDVLALAFVLDVRPYDLLLPAQDSGRMVEATGPGKRQSDEIWSWALHGTPIGSPTEGLPAGTSIVMGDTPVHQVPEQVATEISSDAFKEAVRAVVREMLDHEK
jgi:hypothetical protein